MDSNRTAFLLLKAAGDFASRSLKFVWDGDQQAFRLEQQQAHFFPEITPEQALSAWQNALARVIDNYGQIGAISADGKRFQVKADWQGSQWLDVRASSDNPDARSMDQLTLAPADAAMYSSLRGVTKEILDTLTTREAKVLRMRFGIEMNTDHTLEEVGKQFDVTRERIRQIEAKALRKLRHPTRSDKLRSFLDQNGN